jgi:hypothetical protein
MDERRRFVIRLKDGGSMASLCREYGISRPTGYKIFERYEECGIEGLTDRSRRPYRYANSLPPQNRTYDFHRVKVWKIGAAEHSKWVIKPYSG